MIADLLARRKHPDSGSAPSQSPSLMIPAGGMEKVVCISAAKVPIVKIWDPELGLACDMNVNNTLALENTRMIRIYVEADPRVRQLAMIIKYWTRRRVVNDAGMAKFLLSGVSAFLLTQARSIRRYFEFVHLDLSYRRIPPAPNAVSSPYAASASIQDAQKGRQAKRVRR
jgi:hypothetical protein